MEVPTQGRHLCLRLEGCIGRGGSAVVYAAKATSNDPEGCASPIEAELCVKLAKPHRCRTLAREGWVYEQLAEGTYQGVIVPRCYGFFAADLPHNQFPVSPISLEDLLDTFDFDTADLWHDERLCDEEWKITDSTPGGRELSPWVDWRRDPSAPLLCVLVMTRGGGPYTLHEDHLDKSNRYGVDGLLLLVFVSQFISAEVFEILDDLSADGILHQDLRPANIIRAPADAETCPRHNRVHKWNLIDFALTRVDTPDDSEDKLRFQAVSMYQKRGYTCRRFA